MLLVSVVVFFAGFLFMPLSFSAVSDDWAGNFLLWLFLQPVCFLRAGNSLLACTGAKQNSTNLANSD
jgi:hypothetical protein